MILEISTQMTLLEMHVINLIHLLSCACKAI